MVDILTKTSANEVTMKQEEMEEEFEDGELVEEGEIFDDEDEQKPGLIKSPPHNSQGSPANGQPASPGAKKPSREELLAPKNTGRESPWTIKPLLQPQNDDVFGFADRDFRSMGSSEDRDFRWTEGPANGGDADFDFRDRRRRHSPSPPSHLKRARPSPPHGPFADEGPPFMGARGGFLGGRGFRGRGRGGGFGAPRWAERHICKFFREGYCRDGENCAYSHNAEDSKRRPEVCKFYYSGHCKKGLACHHLHGEFPCKAFHKGECTRDPCQFSHLPLTDYTRPLIEASMRQEEYSMRNALPQGPPVRRRVLLPGGPVPGAPQAVTANPAAVAAAQAAAAIVTQGLVAPPGVTPGPFPPGYVPQSTAGGAASPTPAAALPPPSVVVPRLGGGPAPAPQQQPAAPVAEASAAPPAAAASPAPTTSAASIVAANAAAAAVNSQAGFSISMMLAQIAGTMPEEEIAAASQPPQQQQQDEEMESPESPPPANNFDPFGMHAAGSGLAAAGGELPYAAGRGVVYRLRLVDREAPYSGVSSAIVTTASQQSDPRIARLLASQFDAVSSMIAAQQQQAAAAPPAAAAAAPAAAPRDPRARADPRRDPRQRGGDPAEQSRVSWMPQMS